MGCRSCNLLVLLVMVIVLVGCTSPALTDNKPPTPPSVIKPADSGRPDIPRVNPPADTPDNNLTPSEQPSGPTMPILLLNRTPKSDLDIPVGDTIGKQHPIITAIEFPLLKHPSIRVNGNLLLGYQEQLRFDFGANSTGNVTFGQDENTLDIGSFLRFESQKPIFEYSATLDRGTFYDIQGRDIQILGHTYTIAEANNASVTLFGKDVANNLQFTDNRVLVVNSSGRTATLCKVTPNRIAFELFTDGKDDGDILLSSGESLADNVGHLKMASDMFDIRYAGAPMQGAALASFSHNRFGYVLKTTLKTGPVELPLVEQDAGHLILGRAKEPLRITPCPSSNQYCIASNTDLLFTTSDGRTYPMRYDGTSVKPNEIHFSDYNGNDYTYKFSGTPGTDATTNIIVGKVAFSARVGLKDNASGEYNITVEQGYRNGRVDIVLLDGTIVRVGDVANSTLPVDIVVSGARTKSGHDETLRLNLTFSGSWMVDAGNLTFVEDRNTSDTFAQTGYGTTILLTKNHRSLPLNQGDSAQVLVPLSQAYGIVSLED